MSVLDIGVIETRASLPLDERIQLIYDGVATLFDKHAPAALVLEDLYAEYRFPRTALLMAHARGVVCLIARQRGVRVMPLAPAEVKRAITGYGGAHKEQVQRAVQRLLALPEPPRISHVADALALALTGLRRLSFLGGGLRPPSSSEGASKGRGPLRTTPGVAPAKPALDARYRGSR